MNADGFILQYKRSCCNILIHDDYLCTFSEITIKRIPKYYASGEILAHSNF